jgi:glycosyltransferase involved in cell wall biosynthesis
LGRPAGRLGARRLRRLLLLLPSARFGGTERHSAELAARLGAAGMEVTLAATPALLAPLAAAMPRGPGTPRLLPAAIAWDEAAPVPAHEVGQAAAAAALIAAEAPDVALVPLPWPNAGLGLLRALAAAGVPRLVALHLAAEGPAPEGIAAALPAIDAAGAAWCAVSAPVARRAARFFGLPDGRVAVLPNPAPPPPQARTDRAVARATLRSVLGLRGDARLLLFVGRLEEAKGADLLPALTDRLTMPIACLGDGPLRGHLDAQAMADPRSLLRLLGQLADPTPWYLAADALLLPSRLEGAPLVFFEAAAHGCPVVATAAALEGLGEAAPRLARIAAEAEAVALAGAVRGLFADPAGTAAMVALAAAEAARRNWDDLLDGWLGQLRAAASLAATTRETMA